jgi:FAD/FMN-containing dehydrogenase
MNKYHGKGQVVVKPKTVKEVSEIMKYCWEKGIAVVPQGGNTGLVGTSPLSRHVVHKLLS